MAAKLEDILGQDGVELNDVFFKPQFDNRELLEKVRSVSSSLQNAQVELTKDIIGQAAMLSNVTIAMICGGHGLLQGAPGAGKTTLSRSISTVFGLASKVIGFRSDMMPADIIGQEILKLDDHGNKVPIFIQGPVFTQFLLADEINRAPPRTQAPLLQAMQEKIVMYNGEEIPLPAPFHVLATQNPVEQEGTYPLPEAQLDRFLIKYNVPYLDKQNEIKMWFKTTRPGGNELRAKQVMTDRELMDIQHLVRCMPISDQVADAIYRVSSVTRPENPDAPELVKKFVNAREEVGGIGPRGGQAMFMTVRGRALMDGRLAPSLDDVKEMAVNTLSHRFALKGAAKQEIKIGDRTVPLTPRTLVAKLAYELT